ncbi:MAG: ATP-binding protein, partial [Chthoniobacteraceae bacterium]
QEVQRVHEQLLETSRKAGMAEVATGVIHNVGNVLNSVNVSATLVAEKLDPDPIEKLVRAANLLREQDPATLAEFLANDPKGKILPLYLAEVSAQLAVERRDALAELASLRRNIEHIKEIVAKQQDHARVIGIVQATQVAAAIDEALRMTQASLEGSGILVVRDFGEVPDAMADPHQLLQIFVNIIRNAKQAIDEASPPDRRLTIRVLSPDLRYVQAIFTDTGIGIAEENLTRVFAHGFTTRAHGHGFGLHSAALAAQQVAGCLTAHSDGIEMGATFTLELPVADT